MTLRELVSAAYANAKVHGFHDDMPGTESCITASDYVVRARTVPEKLCLIHSEVSEALEAFRDVGPEGVLRVEFDEKGKPVGLWSELADIVIRVGDLCGLLDIDLEHAVAQKMIYNKSRPYKHGKAL